jgi:hypothetical protein
MQRVQNVVEATAALSSSVDGYLAVVRSKPITEIQGDVKDWRLRVDALARLLREHDRCLQDYQDDADRHR